MAYWRSYRKFRAEASALAECDTSSDEEDNNQSRLLGEDSTASINGHLSNFGEDSASSGPVPPDNIDDDNASNGILCDNLVASYSSSQEYIGSEESFTLHDSDFDDVENSNAPSVSPVTLRQELARWATKHQCRRGAVNELLEILRQEGHSLPKDSRTLLDTPREVVTLSKCGGQYVYLGIEHGVCEILSKYPSFLEKNTSIDLMINVDGLPLFKSSNAQFWPILGCFGNLKVFLIALFYGNTKPNSVEEYLHDFLQEFDKLKLDGVRFKSYKFSLNVLCCLCDAPARSFLKCTVGHTGYYSCERCVIKGSWNGRVVFNSSETCALRTDEKFVNLNYSDHQKQASPLTDHSISCIQQFPLDYMHMVCLGVTRRLLHFLRNGPKECKLSSRQILQISENLISLNGSLPSEFSRQPRSLVELDRWKATEFRQFLLYTGPVVLRNVVPNRFYQHFLSLSVAISIMLDTNTSKRNSYLQYARELITHFVHNCESLYGNTFVVYNVHSLIHLPDDVHFFQTSLNEISCFSFENHMQQLKRLVRNARNPVVQVVKRLEELQLSDQNVPMSWHYTTISTKLKDSCFLLKNNKYAFVVEKRQDKTLVCDIISERCTEGFFESPADSKLFDIVLVRNVQQKAKRCLVERHEILCKAVCLPYHAAIVIFPLHHEVERR